ncbi:MAG TPA: hypothetical protein VLB85_12030 [Acidimicrobiia bacterium]|nr:hypothetical protein [Acidimicrobiia bacterium]
MHLIPVVIVAHAGEPAGWEDAVGALASVLERHPDLSLAVRMPGAVVEHLTRSDPDGWKRLVEHPITWLAGGYSDPVLTTLPPAAVEAQLDREHTAMEGAGITPSGLWLGDAWEPGLVTAARRAELPLVYLDTTVLGEECDRPAAVERAGETVIAIPVHSRPPGLDGDGLVGVRTTPADLALLVEEHSGRFLDPESYLSLHRPGPKVAPAVVSPTRSDDAEHFYRRLLLLIGEEGERSGPRDEILRLQSREFITGTGQIAALPRLLEARTVVDAARHRGDTWVTTKVVDWDADGIDEIQIETAATSLVVDPHLGSIDVWDDKTGRWPICAVDPPTSAVLIRRLDADGEEPPVEPMRVERRSEARAEAQLTLVGGSGARVAIEARGRSLDLSLDVTDSGPIRFGPEIPLALRGARIRVDGGDWTETSAPLALSGHRFRLTDDDHGMLISAPRPCDMFVRPLPGHGIVIWPHWVSGGGGSYRLAFSVV